MRCVVIDSQKDIYMHFFKSLPTVTLQTCEYEIKKTIFTISEKAQLIRSNNSAYRQLSFY
jgi:hypothetical protein